MLLCLRVNKLLVWIDHNNVVLRAIDVLADDRKLITNQFYAGRRATPKILRAAIRLSLSPSPHILWWHTHKHTLTHISLLYNDYWRLLALSSHNDRHLRRSWSNSNFKPQTSEELASMSFIDGLGKGQMISRQGLTSPYLGDIQLSLCDRRGNLEVEVIRARNLVAKTSKVQPRKFSF